MTAATAQNAIQLMMYRVKKGGKAATEVVNGRSESRVDEYDVLAFDGRTWKDRLISSSLLPEAVGSEFTSVHVGQGFKLPGCHPTS